eukprot:gene36653-49397_t
MPLLLQLQDLELRLLLWPGQHQSPALRADALEHPDLVTFCPLTVGGAWAPTNTSRLSVTIGPANSQTPSNGSRRHQNQIRTPQRSDLQTRFHVSHHKPATPVDPKKEFQMTPATNRPINRKVVLTQFVTGMVGPEHFRIEEEPARAPEKGELLIKADSLSIDAFIRTSLNATEGLHQQVPVGSAIVALGVGRVIESNAPGFEVGDAVTGPLMAQTYTTSPAPCSSL